MGQHKSLLPPETTNEQPHPEHSIIWEVWSRAGLLHTNPVDIWGWPILCGGAVSHVAWC